MSLKNNDTTPVDLNSLRNALMKRLPSSAKVSSVEAEGPFIVVYSRSPDVLMTDGTIVKDLAKDFRKRIVIRSDLRVRMDRDEAAQKIKEIVPEEAEITDMAFDDVLGEVVIEAKKPGLVIGRNGATLREITRLVFWRPTVVRTPPIQSKMISNIRYIVASESLRRRRALLAIGERIHRESIPTRSNWIRLTPLGGAAEVGRSCLLLTTAESNVLIDAGVNVGSSSPENMFPFFNAPEFGIRDLDAVIISHAHLDHCGFLPFLFKWGFRGPVYCNEATRSLMTLLQMDYLNVAQKEGKLLPYSQKDIKNTILHTIPRRYGEVTDLTPDIRLTLSPAGHILGSSIVHLHVGDGMYNLAIAHDFKFARSRLLEPANKKFPRLEALVIESTYGGPTDMMPARKESERQLVRIINETVRRGGKVLIPSLAVGRAQELLIVIDKYFRMKQLEECPVFLDGMISEATAIHTCHPEYLSADLQNTIFNAGENPFLSEYFVQVDSKEIREEVVSGDPCVIMATSGMLTGGASLDYFLQLAHDPKNSIIFVSYQAERTHGRRVADGQKEFRTYKDGKIDMIPVKMDVNIIEGFSGHSDRRQLMNFIRKVNPRPERIILVHGQQFKSESLAQSIEKKYRIRTQVPQNLESIRLA
ncbi:MAG: beta-CASP ribonuclease aCPSF1 [Candidatus Hodarchaeota archaeon]